MGGLTSHVLYQIWGIKLGKVLTIVKIFYYRRKEQEGMMGNKRRHSRQSPGHLLGGVDHKRIRGDVDTEEKKKAGQKMNDVYSV